MTTRETIITNMCFTTRHDYGLLKEENDIHVLDAGMTESQQEALFSRMAQLFDNCVAPYMEFNHVT